MEHTGILDSSMFVKLYKDMASKAPPKAGFVLRIFKIPTRMPKSA